MWTPVVSSKVLGISWSKIRQNYCDLRLSLSIIFTFLANLCLPWQCLCASFSKKKRIRSDIFWQEGLNGFSRSGWDGNKYHKSYHSPHDINFLIALCGLSDERPDTKWVKRVSPAQLQRFFFKGISGSHFKLDKVYHKIIYNYSYRLL